MVERTRPSKPAERRLPPRRAPATLTVPIDGPTRLNALANLFRYDLRRGRGVVAALRGDPLAVIASLCLLGGAAVAGGWAVAGRWSELAAHIPPGAAAVFGAGIALAFRPLRRLRAGPLVELADDPTVVWPWLALRTLGALAGVAGLVFVPALATGWRPDATLTSALTLAAVGVGIGSAIQLAPPLPGLRLPALAMSPGSRAPSFRDRALRLAWIDLGRRQAGLAFVAWAGLGWLGAAAVGPAGTDPRLQPVTDGAAAGLAFLATVVVLRFDAAAVRLLTFEPTSFRRLVRDVLGLRLVIIAAAAAGLALISGPVVLTGAALGVGFRTLEFLHAVRRSGASARLLAQLETALVLALAVTAGPVAAVWLLVRSAWLYRRAARSMGLA